MFACPSCRTQLVHAESKERGLLAMPRVRRASGEDKQLAGTGPKEFQLLPRAKREQALSLEAQQALAQAEVLLLRQKDRWEREREEAQRQNNQLAEELGVIALAVLFGHK